MFFVNLLNVFHWAISLPYQQGERSLRLALSVDPVHDWKECALTGLSVTLLAANINTSLQLVFFCDRKKPDQRTDKVANSP